jgi:hypothetical protein
MNQLVKFRLRKQKVFGLAVNCLVQSLQAIVDSLAVLHEQ